MSLRRLSNSLSDNYSWVEIGVKEVEISRKREKRISTLPEAINFCHENTAKCCWIFIVEIWQRLQIHLEIINPNHTYSKIKPEIPTHSKPRKLMPIARFQLVMSKNYDFTKTKDGLWTSVLGCLTPSSHVTRLSNSIIKIYCPFTLD